MVFHSQCNTLSNNNILTTLIQNNCILIVNTNFVVNISQIIVIILFFIGITIEFRNKDDFITKSTHVRNNSIELGNTKAPSILTSGSTIDVGLGHSGEISATKIGNFAKLKQVQSNVDVTSYV